MQSEITKNTAKPRRNIPKRNVWTNARIEGRDPHKKGSEWRTIDTMNTENSAYFAALDHTGLEVAASNKLALWGGHGHDLNGTFRGWEFRVTYTPID